MIEMDVDTALEILATLGYGNEDVEIPGDGVQRLAELHGRGFGTAPAYRFKLRYRPMNGKRQKLGTMGSMVKDRLRVK